MVTIRTRLLAFPVAVIATVIATQTGNAGAGGPALMDQTETTPSLAQRQSPAAPADKRDATFQSTDTNTNSTMNGLVQVVKTMHELRSSSPKGTG
ncbi:MAG TPA: hypothetical protein VH950_06170 [Gaiellaceae bacterium]|jgi:hypothetical protein